MKRQIVSILALMALFAGACSQRAASEEPSAQEPAGAVTGKEIQVPGGSYRDISVPELQSMLENKDFTLVNVHIPFEGDLPNTDLSIPYNEIEQHLDQLPAEKDARIVLYCRSDRMSNIAAEELVRLGYTNIWNLEGGFNAWENAGLPMKGE